MLIDTIQQFNKAPHTNKFIPWNTCDLKNACRKQNSYYIKNLKFLNLKMNYLFKKDIKNNTTSLVREAKKRYYSNMLTNCYDTKNTWNVLNNVLNLKQKCKQPPDNCIVYNVNILDSKQMSNEFNLIILIFRFL